MKSSLRTHYEVRTNELHGGSYSQSGYSKYNYRFSEHSNGTLRGMIYGRKQAREHISELRASVYEGKKHLANHTFFIVKVVTIETAVEKFLPIT